mmetsp:Transcript_14160/g.23257  ORF Transcript_14160/g.23257 Transcript_14160/m.23257 type:complete len:97 (+) Transcript_14160:310-600(+)
MPPERGASGSGGLVTWREWNCLMKAMAASYSEVIIIILSCHNMCCTNNMRCVFIYYFLSSATNYDDVLYRLMSINMTGGGFTVYEESASRITTKRD